MIERDRDSYAASFPGQSRHPAILGVNLEARDEGMKYYHKIEERARYLQPQFPVMGQGPPQGRLGLAPPGSRLPYMIIGQGQGTGPPLGRFGLGPPGRFPYMVMPKAKPNVMYVNFDVDYFVMPPLMYSAVRVVSLSDWNLEPYVLSMMQKYVALIPPISFSLHTYLLTDSYNSLSHGNVRSTTSRISKSSALRKES